MGNMMSFILAMAIIMGIIIYFFYNAIRKSNDSDEKFYYFVSFIVIMVPLIVYCLDRYNIPTELGWCVNVDTQNWLDFIGNYSSAGIGVIISVIITFYQIKKNNKDNIERDKENLRVQNMPILKYAIDTENKGTGGLEELIITNVDNGRCI